MLAIGGIVLMLIGVALGLYGLGASGSPPGTTTLNFGMLVDKILYTVMGGGAFAGGAAMLAAAMLMDRVAAAEKNLAHLLGRLLAADSGNSLIKHPLPPAPTGPQLQEIDAGKLARLTAFGSTGRD